MANSECEAVTDPNILCEVAGRCRLHSESKNPHSFSMLLKKSQQYSVEFLEVVLIRIVARVRDHLVATVRLLFGPRGSISCDRSSFVELSVDEQEQSVYYVPWLSVEGIGNRFPDSDELGFGQLIVVLYAYRLAASVSAVCSAIVFRRCLSGQILNRCEDSLSARFSSIGGTVVISVAPMIAIAVTRSGYRNRSSCETYPLLAGRGSQPSHRQRSGY